MAFQWTRSSPPATEFCLAAVRGPVIVRPRQTAVYFRDEAKEVSFLKLRVSALNRSNIGGGDGVTGSDGGNNINSIRKGSSFTSLPNTNYVVPLGKNSSIIRPLEEILRDLNKKIPDNIIKPLPSQNQNTAMPWYQANRMLSFYAPGWCGEVRDVVFSDNGSVTVVYRVTIRGSDGEAHREATGTVSSADNVDRVDPVGAAEEIAFCRACARFGLGLYLYHNDDKTM